ncbi:centromere protein U isoform X2 [Amia ocellicauda]|uniref:centromere protein U isoform X2 n=1 Tax=Amia ocellicauda TaxID=2972642 RepID=UPI0034638A66
MSVKKNKMGRILKGLQNEMRSEQSMDQDLVPTQKYVSPSSPNVSAIPKSSFLDEIESYDVPLHSTALEEELNTQKEEAKGQRVPNKVAVTQRKGQAPGPKTQRKSQANPLTTPRRAKVLAPRSSKKSEKVSKEPESKREAAPVKRNVATRRETTQSKTPRNPKRTRPLRDVSEESERDEATDLENVHKATERRDAAAPIASQRRPGHSRQSGPAKGKGPLLTPGTKAAGKKSTTLALRKRGRAPSPVEDSSASDSPEDSQTAEGSRWGSGSGQQSEASPAKRRVSTKPSTQRERQRSRLPSEPNTQDDHNLETKPHKKRAKPQRRKSSVTPTETASPSRVKKNPKALSEMDVVLEAFRECVSEYTETIPTSAKHAAESFSRRVEAELTEMITMTKELNYMEREKRKVNIAINRKRTRLLEVKNELIRKKAELRKLQKESDQLTERETHLHKGTALLTDLKALQTKYLQHRTSHPQEREVYGASSLPSLLLASRTVLGAEGQLKNINNNLQQALNQSNVK